ncbi:MAG: hypothetical protein AB8E87_07175 [Prochlorococcus sp.]
MAFPISAADISTAAHSGRCTKSSTACPPQEFFEGGHQLEKLEFALAIAQTRGDQAQTEKLAAQIADLGGNIEEPGT